MIWDCVQEGPQQRAEGDADRVVAAEQGDRDAGEAEARRKPARVACGLAEQLAACRPARRRAPESSIAVITMRLALTPLATAADGLQPVARRSKPKRVRLITNQYATPTGSPR